ncbi:MAG: hypothetical protein ACR2PT_16600 [Endozoicomonas sp.]
MADIHIDEFFCDCSRALVLLYNSFPRQVTLYIDDIVSTTATDEFGIPTKRHQACLDALLWLAAEGYIRYHDRIRHEGLDQVVLTERSFLRLSKPTLEPGAENALPPSVSKKLSTLAWQMRKAVNSGSSDAINQVGLAFFNRQYKENVKINGHD